MFLARGNIQSSKLFHNYDRKQVDYHLSGLCVNFFESCKHCLKSLNKGIYVWERSIYCVEFIEICLSFHYYIRGCPFTPKIVDTHVAVGKDILINVWLVLHSCSTMYFKCSSGVIEISFMQIYCLNRHIRVYHL